MSLVLILGLFVVIATAHNITLLEVPQYGDPRRSTDLTCHYENEAGDPALHSVKWYRDNDEMFRYTPGQTPSTRIFNTTSGGVTKGSCNIQSCTISVTLPRRYNARISYTCEVSTEGPRFAVVKQTKDLTVAVTLKEDPIISGVPSSVQPSEELMINCSTAAAMPPANIKWFIDGKPERLYYPWSHENNTVVSEADASGLRSSWRALRLKVTSPPGPVAVRCEAIQPTSPPYVRATNTSLFVAGSPNRSHFTAYGSSRPTNKSGGTTLALTMLVSAHVLSKYSAFSDVIPTSLV